MSNDKKTRRLALPSWARKTLKWGVAALIVVALALSFRASPVPVDTGLVAQGRIEVAVAENGKTRLRDDYVVSAPVAGTLARVTLRPGDAVAAGDVVAFLRPSDSPLLDPRSRAQALALTEAAEARLEQARTREERAEAAVFEAREELRSAEILHEQAGTSRSGLERAEARLRSVEADLRAARLGIRVAEQELAHARLGAAQVAGAGNPRGVQLTAPVAGRVLAVMQDSEGVIQAGAPVLRVGDISELEVVVDFLSADAARIQPGARATVERWGGGDALAARVRTVEPAGFTRLSALGIEEQRVNVILDIESPREDRVTLGDGFHVEARVILWEEDDVLVAPAAAVFRADDGWAAYRVERGRARLVPVEIGRRSDVTVQVLGGLEEGDELVLYAGDQIEDGVRIERR